MFPKNLALKRKRVHGPDSGTIGSDELVAGAPLPEAGNVSTAGGTEAGPMGTEGSITGGGATIGDGATTGIGGGKVNTN